MADPCAARYCRQTVDRPGARLCSRCQKRNERAGDRDRDSWTTPIVEGDVDEIYRRAAIIRQGWTDREYAAATRGAKRCRTRD